MVCMISITYIGPMKTSPQVVGGYATANERLISALSSHDINVDKCPYYSSGGGRLEKLAGHMKSISSVSKGIVKAAFDRKIRVVHITGLYRQFIYIELFYVLLCRLLNVRVLYDIRAGSAKSYYIQSGFIYRYCFKMTLKISNSIAIEGKEYFEFLESLNVPIPFYLPNFIDSHGTATKELVSNYDERSEISLMYFGRVDKSKGIELISSIVTNLKERGFTVRCNVIGPDEDGLIQSICKLEPDIIWHGKQDFDYIRSAAEKADFFLFPSMHLGEGHSNALTEAMSLGLIPVVRDNGFLASVSGEDGVIMGMTAGSEEYADRIQSLVIGGELLECKQKSIKRVQNFYTQNKVVTGLIQHYKGMK
jgi:glycosyltransferase involved in cell wall biosynthesis